MPDEVTQTRPIQVNGINVGVDRQYLRPGDLEVGNGIRPMIDGVVSTRNGRVPAGYTSAALPMLGYHPFYDETVVTNDDDTKSAKTLYHLYKANGRLYRGQSGFDLPLTGFLSNAEARFEEYSGKVYVADGESDPLVVRRFSQQTVGQPPLHEAVRMGIQFPTTNSKPTITKDSPGTGNFNPSSEAITMRVTARIVCSDGKQTSNPSLMGDFETLQARDEPRDVNTRVTVDWTALESSIPEDVTEIEVWIQITPVIFSGTIPIPQEPLAFKKVPADAIDAGSFDRTDAAYDSTARIETTLGIENWQELEISRGYHRGAPPVLYDMRMVNDVMVAAARPDVIYREVIPDGDPISRVFGQQGETRTFLPKDTTIEAVQVDGSYLFWSLPFRPEYMNEWVIVGNGSEPITAVAAFGRLALVFTHSATYVFDPFATPFPELRKAPVSGGTDAPDSVIETSEMIVFKTTAGTWYRFNGATFDVVSNEIAPLFRKEHEDYSGYYRRFDQTKPEQVKGTATSERIYVVYPQEGLEDRALLVADLRSGRPRWFIDTKHDYTMVRYIPEEKRLLAITENGVFFWIEESETDTNEDLSVAAVEFEVVLRRGIVDSRVQDWKRYHLELNTQGQNVEMEIRADDNPSRSFVKTFSTTKREKLKRWLPDTLRGQYATLTLRGSVSKRVEIYGLDLRSRERGEF